jgi:hypothetical protein
MSTLRDGMPITSYEHLVGLMLNQIVYEFPRGRIFTYTVAFGAPCMINIETGEKFFGTDIEKFIAFPLSRLKVVPYIEG